MEPGNHSERLTDREQKILFQHWQDQQKQEVAEQSEPTVQDIAEAYGMPPEEVARQLRAVRAEEALRVDAARQRRAGAIRAVRGAVMALVLLGLGWLAVTHLPSLSSSASAAARHDRQGRRDFDAGNYTAAESESLLAVQEQPKEAAYRINLGNAYYAQNNYVLALPPYQEAMRLEPGSAKYEQYVADTLLALNRPQEAATLFRSALALDPSRADSESGLGASLAKLHKYAEAEAAFRVSNRLSPANASTLDGLGAAIGEQHRIAEAASYFQQAVSLAPGNAQYQNNLDIAEKKLRQGKH